MEITRQTGRSNVIHIPRPEAAPGDVRDALDRKSPKDGRTELERAREYYAQIPSPEKAYEFKNYKAREVCLVLDAIFHEKCAYCESSYRAIDGRNVEHFRPKGAVTEAPNHPGYWWLAATWANLLPSCLPCNQLRRQVTFDSGMTLEEFERARLEEPQGRAGKANSFPVSGANWVLNEGADLSVEDPLLINPCERRPDEHLEWVFDWVPPRYIWQAEELIAFIRPRKYGGVDDAYGKASIAVYGLNRANLFRERLARVKEMQLACQPVVDVFADLGGARAAPEATIDPTILLERLHRYRERLEQFTKPEQQYAGMARAFMAQLEAELVRFASSNSQ